MRNVDRFKLEITIDKCNQWFASVWVRIRGRIQTLGKVGLYSDKNESGHICDVKAICHAIHKTNDLLGTEALRQFNSVIFNLADETYYGAVKEAVN